MIILVGIIQPASWYLYNMHTKTVLNTSIHT